MGKSQELQKIGLSADLRDASSESVAKKEKRAVTVENC